MSPEFASEELIVILGESAFPASQIFADQKNGFYRKKRFNLGQDLESDSEVQSFQNFHLVLLGLKESEIKKVLQQWRNRIQSCVIEMGEEYDFKDFFFPISCLISTNGTSDLSEAFPLATVRSQLDRRDIELHILRNRSEVQMSMSPHAGDQKLPAEFAATRLLRLLQIRGVENIFSNSGTDFTPIIEGLCELEQKNELNINVFQCPHENTSIAMAHGHALISKRPQAVMAHVNVGTANIGMGLINARRAQVPVFAIAGRTPLSSRSGRSGRTNFVQWGQETYDQGAMFREYTKWDYELKNGDQLPLVIDRSLAISQSFPQGPVYLTLPKEPLCENLESSHISNSKTQQPNRIGAATAEAIRSLLNLLSNSKKAVIVTADLGRHQGAVAELIEFSMKTGIGIVEFGKRNFFNFPTEHPHHLGFDPHQFIEEADLVIAIECPVPWIPAFVKTQSARQIISIAIDPLFSDLPLRDFPSHLGLSGHPTETLKAINKQLKNTPVISEDLRHLHTKIFSDGRNKAQRELHEGRLTKSGLSLALSNQLNESSLIFNEYDLDPLMVKRNQVSSWFENSVSSGLGWALGGGLGAKVAAPESEIIITVGDGSYLFNTPLSAQFVASQHNLPIMIVVFDDKGWTTITNSVQGSHPRGAAANSPDLPLCGFQISMEYAKIAEACGGVAFEIKEPKNVEEILSAAFLELRKNQKWVLVHAHCLKS